MHKILEKHILYKAHSKVKEICEPLFTLGLEGFIFMRFFPDGTFIDLATQLPWAEFYLTKFLREEYSAKDIQEHMYLDKDINLWISNPDNVIWKEGSKQFGFGNGLSFSFDEENWRDVFCFYTTINKPSIYNFYMRHQLFFKNFCRYFVQAAEKIILDGKRYKLSSPEIYMPDSNSSPDPFDESSLYSIMNKLKLSPISKLSNREKECVTLASRGKTSRQIADQLFLSPRTVEVHLNNSRHKLNCSNLCQLVSLVAKELNF